MVVITVLEDRCVIQRLWKSISCLPLLPGSDVNAAFFSQRHLCVLTRSSSDLPVETWAGNENKEKLVDW